MRNPVIRLLHPMVATRTRVAILLAVAGLLALKCWYLTILSVDSDEPQHLHVVWAWTQGLIPYRDVFDNHAPLFHLSMAPLLWLVGERADAVVWMRLPMLGLWLGMMYAAWLLGTRLFERGIATAAMLLSAVYPAQFVMSTQFRADNLWALLWLSLLAALARGPLGRRRTFGCGLLAGAAIAASLKTLMLLGCLALAGLVTEALRWRHQGRFAVAAELRALAAPLANFAAGMLVVPLLLAGMFAAVGAGPRMVEALWTHNLVADMASDRWYWREIGMLAGMAICVVVADRMYAAARLDSRIMARALVFLSAGFATIVFHTLWPLITLQDMLPLLPVLALFATAYFWSRAFQRRIGAGRTGMRRSAVRLGGAVVYGLALLLSLADIIDNHPPWQDQADADRAVRALVLSLTPHDGYVMDAKGEAVFRQRPIYPVLETITLRRYARGLLADDIPERLAATGTAVVISDRIAFNDDTRRFLNRNYLDLAPYTEVEVPPNPRDSQGLPRLMVAGRVLAPPAAGGSITFEIEVPTRYAVLAGDRADVRIDDSDCRDGIALAAGEHRLSAGPGNAAVTLVYAPVVAKALAARQARRWAA